MRHRLQLRSRFCIAHTKLYLNTIASPSKRNLYCGIIMSVDLLLCWIAVAPIMYEQPEACPAVSTAALIGYATRYTVGIALVALRVINPLTWQLDPWYLTKATAIYKNSYTAARLMMMLWWAATVCWYADTSTSQCTPSLRAVLLVLIVYDGVLFSATAIVIVSLAFLVGPMRVVTTLLPHPTQIRSVMTKTPSSTSSLASLAALTYSEGMFGADERLCVICLQELIAGDRIRVLHCLHKFHAGCIDEWIGRRSTCPYCKTTVNLETETAMTEWDRQKVDNAIAMSLKQNDKLQLTDDQCIV